ncbi:TRAP transporter small permease [Aurantimonas marina]|uniref:TRAP transporter small permease n=1 Tax=Aurantimonas marina TaxID=2780508 RepID=UPI0019D280BB|nr:TRAP transporter small permease [Aurantimonas marina]
MHHASTVTRIEDVLARISAACIFIASCALVVLIATFGWLVFGRYVLNVTPTWVEQLALVLVGYIAFLGAAAGIHEDSHLGVTMFRDALGEPVRTAVTIAVDLVLAGFGAVMFLAGIDLMRFGWDTLLPMLNIPLSFRTLSEVFCGGLIVLFAGTRAILRILNFPRSDRAATDEAP